MQGNDKQKRVGDLITIVTNPLFFLKYAFSGRILEIKCDDFAKSHEYRHFGKGLNSKPPENMMYIWMKSGIKKAARFQPYRGKRNEAGISVLIMKNKDCHLLDFASTGRRVGTGRK